MGSSSSKLSRSYPKTAKSPSWAGARTPDGPLQEAARPKSIPRASETRTEAIEQDSKDPQLAANLNRLGPVKVDHMQTIRPAATRINRALQQRLKSEEEASSTRTSRNLLHAFSLSDLLEERKSVTSQKELENLAKKYNIDVAKMETVALFVNSPSVDPASVKLVVEDGVEKRTMKASWIDPPITNKQNTSSSSTS
ncbi:hypothetical protein C8Q75DRAFT_729047 [Abortiporus biennis]|nr:hypothetical protein C8Q75DRAFT_729047 [Abortiporus biennis]